MNGFLFDENLPRQIRFHPSLPLTHVESLGIGLSDAVVWDQARTQSLAIVS